MERGLLYNIIYALAASGGREERLFGDCAPLATEAFQRSLAGPGFPELWFELPLAGEPWFDLHALTAQEDLDAEMTFDPRTCGGASEAFEWFAKQGPAARQPALSWDVSSGDLEHPAVQLLKRVYDTQITCDFLAAAGRADAAPAYRAFVERLPQGWFACYTGVFPQRTEPFLRVECIPDDDLQQAYAENPDLLEAHLRQLGVVDLGDTLVPRCQTLAKTPFHLEFQFDVTPEGTASSTVGASARFAAPVAENGDEGFDPNGAAGELMAQVEAWGLADDRWRLLADAVFSKRIKGKGEDCSLCCYPVFLKLRWRNGEPLDAKAYLIAFIQS